MIVLATALLAAGGLQADDIVFAPRVGLQLSKTVQVRHELSLDELGTARDGGAVMRDEVGGWLSGSTRQSFRDEYLAVSDGRPTLFRRTLRAYTGHVKLTLSGRRGAQELGANFSSGLGGLPVLHTWVPEEQTWGRCFDQITAEEDLLEVLQDEADYLGLLPPGPVEVGASWSASPEALRSLLTPGGNTGATPDEDGYFSRMVEVGVGGDLADILGKELAGTVAVTYSELREVEDRRLAVLSVQFSVVSERDRTRVYMIGMPKEEKREATELRQVLVTWVADGTVEILWDIDADHATGAELRAHETLTASISKLAAAGTKTPSEITQRSTYSGQLEIDHTFRETDPKETKDLVPEESTVPGPKEKKKGKKKG